MPSVASSRWPARTLAAFIPGWRREALRTTLWIIPAVTVVLSILAFAGMYALDLSVVAGRIPELPWMNQGSADASRQILATIAAAVITVTGVVFSIVIVALALVSQQFGPRMLRNFIRDLGTQLTLGVFVGTFVYSVLALGSISSQGGRDFVPHIAISFALLLLIVDLMILIYFIHHVTRSMQLNEVIANIGHDFQRAIVEEYQRGSWADTQMSAGEIEGPDHADIAATRSGYLQALSHRHLVDLAVRHDAVIVLMHRPGDFVVAGSPLARVTPAAATAAVAIGLDRGHITGAHRTLSQDPLFAADQLVEIAIRALSPAVNDTFTALTCVDWLTAGLGQLSDRRLPLRVVHDAAGNVRLVEPSLDYELIIDRAFDKIRQAGRGMPAVAIRQLDSLARLAERPTGATDPRILLNQAEMIQRASEEAIPEPRDRARVMARYEHLLGMPTSTASSSAQLADLEPG